MSKYDKDWIIDSGATYHICSNIDLFKDYKSVTGSNKFITVPDGRKVQITHIRKISLNNDIILYNVLYVPEFYFNLISVKRLCKDLSCQVVFIHDKCYVQGLSQRNQMLLGSLHNGLYHTEPEETESQICCTIVEEAQLWHLRMWHKPFSHLKLVNP